MSPDARRRIVYVFAKEPVAGQVKTRLCPPLEPAAAAALQTAFLTDTLARVRDVGGLDLRIAASPALGGPVLADLAGRFGARIEPQGEGDLGVRMGRILKVGAAEGTTVLLGADSPDLPIERIQEAFEAVRRCDVVFGPADDGGYYLVAAEHFHVALFPAHTPWGGPQVLSAALRSVRDAGLEAALLPLWRDVDEPSDLEALRSRLRLLGASGRRLGEGATQQLLERMTSASDASVNSLPSSRRR